MNGSEVTEIYNPLEMLTHRKNILWTWNNNSSLKRDDKGPMLILSPLEIDLDRNNKFFKSFTFFRGMSTTNAGT